MKSSFIEINNLWQSKSQINNLIILKSSTNEERSNFFIDLILTQAQDHKVYICSSSRYLLEDKIDSLDFKKKYNIVFIESQKELSSYFKGTFFFYEPTTYWYSGIQTLLANGKNVVVDYNPQANFTLDSFFSYQEISIKQSRRNYQFTVYDSLSQETHSISCYKPANYLEFSYFLETNNLKFLLEEFVGEQFHHRSFVVKNYYPKTINLFDRKYSLRVILKEQLGITSFKFYQKIKEKMVNVTAGSVEINFSYLNLCLNISKTHPQVTVDYFYQILDAPLNNIQFRRPHFEFFSVLKLARLIKMIKYAGVQDSCCLESLELDYELLLKRNNELKEMIPRKIQSLLDLKYFFSSLTYKYYDNQSMPLNLFHQLEHPRVFAPKDYFELCQIKLQFKNCVSLYFNDILDKKTIILKISNNNQKFCVSLDAKTYELKSVKLSENREPDKKDVWEIQELLEGLLQQSNLNHRVSTKWFQLVNKLRR